jgi:threonine/homoserine/homoserine lactone efflux protein
MLLLFIGVTLLAALTPGFSGSSSHNPMVQGISTQLGNPKALLY